MIRITLLAGMMCFLAGAVFAQQSNYDQAMKAYEKKDFQTGARLLDTFIQTKGKALSSSELYNSACIYAMAGKADQAFKLLEIMVGQYFMSDADRLEKDSDLAGLRSQPRWTALLKRVKENQRTEPARTAAMIRSAIARTKVILAKDKGNLWGTPLWDDHLLILDPKNKLYQMQDTLRAEILPERMLSQTNAPQDFRGGRYAVVLTRYLADSSATMIHELFHLAQEKQIRLNGNPVNYLDTYQAREYLRLEYQALRNALGLARKGAPKAEVAQALGDAVCFRKLRRTLAPEAAAAETDIETSEGLANYTGFKLSDRADKYQLTISEIDMRESAPTYTRSFPYATGPAYGFLFDYLGFHWRQGLKVRYNFSDIFEAWQQKAVSTDSASFKVAAERNNYAVIHAEELARKAVFDRKTAWFTRTLVEAPTLRVKLVTEVYSRSFDMNGTFVLGDHGLVYTSIRGTDLNGQNFGNFQTTTTGDEEHPAGILGSFDGKSFIFPLPLRTEGNKLIGPNYEILLNAGWVVQKVDDLGNLEIVKR